MTAATAIQPSVTEVEFHLAGAAQPVMLVPVKVNERGPFQFILDTGAGTSLLTPSIAKELDIKITGAKEGQTAGGKVAVSLARADSLGVGDLRVHDVDLGVVDLSQISTAVGARIDGDLGYNFLKGFRVTIDYGKRTIRFEDPLRRESFAMDVRTEVPLRLANPAKPLILLDVYLNGSGPFQFAVDTGTSTTAIAPALAQQLELSTAAAGPITTGGQAISTATGRVQSFQLGSAKIDNVDVVVSDIFTMLSSVVGAKLDGIVGYNFLRHYTVVIDYPGATLSLI